MKHTSSQLKAISRKALDGNWGLPMGANIILGVISFIVIFFITFFFYTLLLFASHMHYSGPSPSYSA